MQKLALTQEDTTYELLATIVIMNACICVYLCTCFCATICICWCTLASSSLPSPLVCSISSSFLMLSSLALSVCFWVSILISSSWLQSDFTHTNSDASNEYSRTIRRAREKTFLCQLFLLLIDSIYKWRRANRKYALFYFSLFQLICSLQCYNTKVKCLGLLKYFCLPLVSNERLRVVRKVVITFTVSLRIAISRDKWSFST